MTATGALNCRPGLLRSTAEHILQQMVFFCNHWLQVRLAHICTGVEMAMGSAGEARGGEKQEVKVENKGPHEHSQGVEETAYLLRSNEAETHLDTSSSSQQFLHIPQVCGYGFPWG